MHGGRTTAGKQRNGKIQTSKQLDRAGQPASNGEYQTCMNASSPPARMRPSGPLNGKLAIALALGSMWVLGCAGTYILITSEAWWFDTYNPAAFKIEIRAFYLAWTGAQLPAAAVAGMVISASRFTHPARITFWTVAGYQLVFTIIRAFFWPWSKYPNLDQSVPIGACLVATVFLIGFSVFITWFMPYWGTFLRRLIRHRG
jgi:hypothetical protein